MHSGRRHTRSDHLASRSQLEYIASLPPEAAGDPAGRIAARLRNQTAPEAGLPVVIIWLTV